MNINSSVTVNVYYWLISHSQKSRVNQVQPMFSTASTDMHCHTKREWLQSWFMTHAEQEHAAMSAMMKQLKQPEACMIPRCCLLWSLSK